MAQPSTHPVAVLAKVEDPALQARKSYDAGKEYGTDVKVRDADVESADPKGEQTGLDYSGFKGKTDPAEIKLVRKMDIYIMLSLWSMYWLNVSVLAMEAQPCRLRRRLRRRLRDAC